ncbi:MAG: hypothetical protein IPN23_08320 [Elusimicrobia bacterium]|nr:hypothetical protein [Elusimicrobiota bacterium]
MALAPIVRRFFDVIRLRRWGAVGLSLLLAWPGSGGWSGGGLWSERRRAETAAPHTEGFWSALPVSRGVPGSGPSASVSAPRGARAIVDALAPFGTVRKIRWLSDRAPVVVHVHDVHANESAQRNIGRALERLMARAPLDALALEGAFGPIDLERFRRFPDRAAVATVADRLLAEGRISGPIHAVLTLSTAAPPLWGVDDPRLHAANVEAYRRSAPAVPAASAVLVAERAKLAAAPVSTGLRRLDAAVVRYHTGRAGLGDYLRAVMEAAGESARAPTAAALLNVLALEQTLDFAAVADERRRLFERLVPVLTPAENDGLIARAADHRAGALSHGDFYDFVSGVCRRKGIDPAPGAALSGYFRYVRRAQAIDGEALYAELPRLEDAAYGRAARGPLEAAWARRARRITLYEKLAAFALTPPEWRALRSEDAGQAPEGVDWATFTAFYQRADERDGAMARSVETAVRAGSATRVALVTGGYHAAGVGAALGRAGISVIDFVPRVEAVDGPAGTAALSVFVREKSPLERLFQGNRLFLAPAPFPAAEQERLRVGVPLVRELRDAATDHTEEEADAVALAGPDSPPLAVWSEDGPEGAVMTVRNTDTGGTVRVTGRLDAGGGLAEIRETPVASEWGDRLRVWVKGARGSRARGGTADFILWGEPRRLRRAQDRLAQGRGALLSRAERRGLAREWTEDLFEHSGLADLLLPGAGTPGDGEKSPSLLRAVRAAAALFQEETPRGRDGRPIEFWAVDSDGLDPWDRGAIHREDTAEKRVVRFRGGDIAAVQRFLLTEEILPIYGLDGDSRAGDRRIAAALAEEVLTAGVHFSFDDFWNIRAEEGERYRSLSPAQHDRALRAAARFRSRFKNLFPGSEDIAEEYWAVRTERLRDAGPRRRSTMAGLLGWYGRARVLAGRGRIRARLVATEELRDRFYRLLLEAGVATHLAPHRLAFGIQQGLARLESADRLRRQARAAGAAEAGRSPTVIDGISRALIDVSVPFVLYAKLPNGRDAFPLWLDKVHQQIVSGPSIASAREGVEPLARVLPSDGAAFVRLTPELVESARLCLAGALSFDDLRAAWSALFLSAGVPADSGEEGLRTLWLVQNLGTPLSEAFEGGANDLVEILPEQTPARRLGRVGWDLLRAPDAPWTEADARALFWNPNVPDDDVALGDGVERLLEWIAGDAENSDPEAAVRDFVLGWSMSDSEARAALPILEARSRETLGAVAPTPAHRTAGEAVMEDIQKGAVSPVQRAARWIQFLGALLAPGRLDPPNSEDDSPAMALRVFENTLRQSVFSLDAFLANARAVREIHRWERGERGLSSSRRRPEEVRFPWTGQRGGLRGWGFIGPAAILGAGLWGVPGTAEAAGLALPAVTDALWPAVTLVVGTAVFVHGAWRARRTHRAAPRRAAEALGAAVATRASEPLERLLDELEATPLSLDVDGSAFLQVVLDRGWDRRPDFLKPLRDGLRGQGVGLDFVSLRTALAVLFQGDYPTPNDAPVLRVWLADEEMAGRVPRNPGADAVVIALNPAADAVLRAAGHKPLDGAGLVQGGVLSLAAVERFTLARGVDPGRFAGCRLLVPMSLPLRADGARTDLFRQAIVVLMDALRSVPLKPMDLDAIDRVARAIARSA